MTDILFLIKEGYNYSPDYNAPKVKGGLFNSTYFTSQALIKNFPDLSIEISQCVDGNSIDNRLHIFKPKVCILEAIWVTPEKLTELVKLHPKVKFIVLVHSKFPFLAMEGNSISWLTQFIHIPNVQVAFNNKETCNLAQNCRIPNIYLPNLYMPKYKMEALEMEDIIYDNHVPQIVHIGCFGAIRPLKNQLFQAAATIEYGKLHNKNVIFHINAGRTEQSGMSVLKNIRALFENQTRHLLIEHGWLSHKEFLQLISEMDLGLQVSFTESFNIVTADFVAQGVPIIVSNDITWMPNISRTDTFNDINLVSKIDMALRKVNLFTAESKRSLKKYNKKSLIVWSDFINTIKP